MFIQQTKNKSAEKLTNHSMLGFSLIEMMLSMLIGTIILSGIFTIFANSREAQRTMDQHLIMTGDARFALELITQDLRQASNYGGINLASLVECTTEDTTCTTVAPAAECSTGWTYDLDLPIYSPLNDAAVAAYAANAGCPITSHVAGTDVIELRFVETTTVANADLVTNTAYVRSNFKAGSLFTGTTLPTFSGDTNDSFTQTYKYTVHAYYISSFTDTVGDGIPSLRRIEFQGGAGGPFLIDRVLMPGVENLQIQYGIDTDGNDEIDKYVNASNVSTQSVFDNDDSNRTQAKADWGVIKAVKVWVVTRAELQEDDLNTSSASGIGFELGGFTIPDATLNDGYRRQMFSNVVSMKNMGYGAVSSTSLSP